MDFFGTILTGAVLLALFFGLMTLIAVIGLSSVVGWGLIIGGIWFGIDSLLYL